MSEIWSEMYTGVHVKYSLFLSYFNNNLIFSADFRKILKISWKPVQWEPRCSMQTDGRTDMKLRVVFCSFAKAPNEWCKWRKKKFYVNLSDCMTLPYNCVWFMSDSMRFRMTSEKHLSASSCLSVRLSLRPLYQRGSH